MPKLAANQPRKFFTGGVGWGLTPEVRNADVAWDRDPMTQIERWDTHEIALEAAGTYGNPFRDVALTATFTHPASRISLTVDGFFDGGKTWRLRFMPSELGTWTYRTRSSDRGLDGHTGTLTCVPPEKPYLHGPLIPRGHHFFHADGTRRFLISTRMSCHFAEPAVWPPLFEHLRAHRINRVLFIMGGVAGTVKDLWAEGEGGPDFWRFCVDKFQAIDAFIDALRRADILASPYFYYFNDKVQRGLSVEQDRAYVRYGMARFGAYANVMPVLSNEVDQKFGERLGQYDSASHTWANELGSYLKGLAVFGVPVTVHNPMETLHATHPSYYTLLRDWPFAWAQLMLRQIQLGALSAVPALSDDTPEQQVNVYNARGYARHNQLLIDLRRFAVPVINEEPGYEMGGITSDGTRLDPRAWNTQTADTLVPTFWTAATAGAYAMWGHAATYALGDPLPAIRQSPTPVRLRILHDFVAALPYHEMEPANDLVSDGAVEIDGQVYRTNFCLAKAGQVYLVFSLQGGPVTVALEPGGSYDLTQLDPRSGARAPLGQRSGGPQTIDVQGREQVLLCRRP